MALGHFIVRPKTDITPQVYDVRAFLNDPFNTELRGALTTMKSSKEGTTILKDLKK